MADEKLSGVYLSESEPARNTTQVPHKVIQDGRGATWFACQYKAGDWMIHKHEPCDQSGYGGSNVTFLLEDGSFRTVKGPWRTYVHENSEPARLFAEIGVDGLTKAFRLAAGNNLCDWDHRKRKILHEEPEFILGEWKQRVRPEWAGLEMHVYSRDGYRMLRAKDVQDIIDMALVVESNR